MKQLNDFLSEMLKVAKVISKIECPDDATSYFKTQYNSLEKKSELIENDLDGLFDLSTKERYLVKNEINIKIEKINDVFRSNENKYYKSGYYDSALQEELSKFNELFFLTYRFMQNLGSTQSKNYPYALLKKTYEDIERDPNIIHGEQISLKKVDIKKLSEHLSSHFVNSQELYSVLIGNIPKTPLIFKGNSTEWLYVFNRLKLDGKIVEGRQEISEWIVNHFLFKDKKSCEVKKAKLRSIYNQYQEDINKIPKEYDHIQQIQEFYN